MPMQDRSGWNLIVFIGALMLAAGVAWALLGGEELPPDELGAPFATGMPMIVAGGDGPVRVLLLTRREGRRYYWGYSNGMRLGSPASETFVQTDLWAFDSGLAVRWRHRIPVDMSDPILSGADARHAVVADPGGRALAGVRRTPPVAPLTFATPGGGVLDGPAPAVPAPPWTTFDTPRWLARGVVVEGRWTGLLTDTEAEKLASAAGLASGWHPGALGATNEGEAYRLWTGALTGAGGVDGLRVLGDEGSFVGAGLLSTPDGPVPGADDGVVYLLMREPGIGLAVARVDLAAGAVAWRTPLRQKVLAQAVHADGALLLYGHEAPPGTTVQELGRHAVLTVVAAEGTRTDRAVASLD